MPLLVNFLLPILQSPKQYTQVKRWHRIPLYQPVLFEINVHYECTGAPQCLNEGDEGVSMDLKTGLTVESNSRVVPSKLSTVKKADGAIKSQV